MHSINYLQSVEGCPGFFRFLPRHPLASFLVTEWQDSPSLPLSARKSKRKMCKNMIICGDLLAAI